MKRQRSIFEMFSGERENKKSENQTSEPVNSEINASSKHRVSGYDSSWVKTYPWHITEKGDSTVTG